MNTNQLKLLLKILQLKLQVLLLRKKLTIPNLGSRKGIVVHYDSGGWSFERVNEYHRRKWGFRSSLGYYCGYHYYIDYDGRITQARADNEEGAHTRVKNNPYWWNLNTIGICLQGNNTVITKEQKQSLRKLLDRLRIKYGIPYSEVYAHREIKPTLCPGQLIYNWLSRYRKPVRKAVSPIRS